MPIWIVILSSAFEGGVVVGSQLDQLIKKASLFLFIFITNGYICIKIAVLQVVTPAPVELSDSPVHNEGSQFGYRRRTCSS